MILKNDNSDLALETGVLAMSLLWGYKQYEEVIDWADIQILERKTVSENLFSLSLSKSKTDMIAVLNEMSRPVNNWSVLDEFLRNLPRQFEYGEAKKLAKNLYRHVCSESELPDRYLGFYGIDDVFNLHEGGYTAFTREQVVERFQSDIQYVIDQM